MSFKSLISPAELAAIADITHTRIIDCRHKLGDTSAGRKAYLESHIPNAIYAHLEEHLSGPIIKGQTGRHPLPERDNFLKQIEAWGIDNQTQVVVYDDMGGAIASRLWWMLRWMGHESVALLDGGFAAWLAKGFGVETGNVSSFRREFVAGNACSQTFDADEVAKLVAEDKWFVIDSRGASRYRGEEEPIDPVAGHIPGALSMPFAGNLDADGFFLNSAQLEARFRDVIGETPAKNCVFYCGSGVTAAHNLLALYHCGLGEGGLYVGSWSDWTRTGERPVATGDEA